MGLPILVIYVIACPLVALVILAKNRYYLSEIESEGVDGWKVKKYMFLLYQGLKPDRYYWEFVNTLRKFCILAISSLMISVSLNIKLLVSVGKCLNKTLVLMMGLVRVQRALKPYKKDENNDIELLGTVAGTVTIF